MHKRRFNLINKQFARVTVIAEAGVSKYGHAMWQCQCNCGKVFITAGHRLVNGKTKSCSCYNKEIVREIGKQQRTHGKCNTPEYSTWTGMMQRCTNSKTANYSYYGARGIAVCKRWEKFVNFFEDMGKRPSKEYTIERINNSKNYEKLNCKWGTRREQSHNTRISKNNTTGHIGVTWNKHRLKYQAKITNNYKSIHLGLFTSMEDAIKARKQGELKYWCG